MFPFLAPLHHADHKCRIDIDKDRVVTIQFLADSPHVSRPTSAATAKSAASASSRPNSRAAAASPASQPSSARSKSSPQPPIASPAPPPQAPPAPRRFRANETSSAMKTKKASSVPSAYTKPKPPAARRQPAAPPSAPAARVASSPRKTPRALFGGDAPSPFADISPRGGRGAATAPPAPAGSAFGPGSAFEAIPGQREPTRSFGRKSVLEKEHQTGSLWDPPANSGPFFPEVEQPIESPRRRAKDLSQPGPERVAGDDEEKMEESVELPDPDCPAAKFLAEQEEYKKKYMSTPSPEEAMDQPGPDLGEEEEEECTGNGPSRPDSSEGAGPGSGGSDAVSVDSDGLSGASDPMALVIRGAQVVNDDSVFLADVLIQDGQIKQVATSVEAPKDAQVVEANGRMLLPAGIDVHTRFSAPNSADDFLQGSKAAVAGGTATVIDVVSPSGAESLLSAVTRVHNTAAAQALCNVGLSVAVRTWNEAVKKDMELLVREHGVNSFVIEIDGDDKMYQILEHCRSLGAHARVLPENRDIVPLLEQKMLSLGITGAEGYLQSRPEELEAQRVASICTMSQLTNCPVSILSLSSAQSASRLDAGRQAGALAHAEVAAPAIATDGTHYFNKCSKHASDHMTDVPLRPDSAADRLVNTIACSPLAVCASGHHAVPAAARSGKDFTCQPRGVAAVEERLSVLWEKAVRSGRLDPMRFVAVTSTNAAKIFNLYPKKGRIAVGADADVVLWEPSAKRTLGTAEAQSAADTSVFEGLSVHGRAALTVVGGRIAWKEGMLVDQQKDQPGGPQVIKLSPHSPHLFSVVQMREKTNCFEKVDRADNPSNGASKKTATSDSPFDRPTSAHRKNSHLQSSINIGDTAPDNRAINSRVRNPPGGRSTGFW